MVGSGYMPPIETSTLLQRGGTSAPAAGRQFYLLKVEDGTLLGNTSGASCGGSGCLDVGDEPSPAIKNALQADPSAAGDNGVPIVRKAYIGDLDGRYWRLDFTSSGSLTKTLMIVTNPAQPIFSSSALLFIGSADVYMFFSTGSDLLPTASPYGVGTFALYALKDNHPATGATLKFRRNLSPVTHVGGIANGERPSTAPSVAGDIVFFTSTSEDASAPCSDFTANLYAFTYLGGAAYDTNGNNTLDTNESPLVKRMPGRATSPFIVDQHLYFGTAGATGFNIEMFGDPEDFNNGVGQVGIRVLSWREIR
jgi:Tfp pilus tip-associated adhesin PilY1